MSLAQRKLNYSSRHTIKWSLVKRNINLNFWGPTDWRVRVEVKWIAAIEFSVEKFWDNWKVILETFQLEIKSKEQEQNNAKSMLFLFNAETARFSIYATCFPLLPSCYSGKTSCLAIRLWSRCFLSVSIFPSTFIFLLSSPYFFFLALFSFFSSKPSSSPPSPASVSRPSLVDQLKAASFFLLLPYKLCSYIRPWLLAIPSDASFLFPVMLIQFTASSPDFGFFIIPCSRSLHGVII